MTTSTSTTVTIAAVQAEPVWFDLRGTLDKTLDLIARAAEGGAELVAFPETWLPGYPTFVWLGDDAYQAPFYERYHENSLVLGSSEHREIEEAARVHAIGVVLGFSERDGDHVYMAQAYISATGETVFSRRKIRPSGPEGDIFATGEVDGLVVATTPFGVLGALNCSENRRPLMRHALQIQGETVHVASWPHFGIMPDNPQMTAETSMMSTAAYAAESEIVVLAPTMTASPRYLEVLQVPAGEGHKVLIGRGATRIFGADGQDLADRLDPAEEGILFAQVERTALHRPNGYDAPFTAALP